MLFIFYASFLHLTTTNTAVFGGVPPRDGTLTHQRAEGDDGQQPLDQHAEPVRQGSAVAAVRVRFVDVRHVRDTFVQESPHQEDPTVSVHVHDVKKKQ